MKIGTRGSALALAQARLIASRIGEAEIVVVRTWGDKLLGQPDAGNGHRGMRSGQGDKSRWVAELEQALLDGNVDLAVHSAKDVPGEPTAGLKLLGAPARAPVEDALIGVPSLEELPERGCVGTSSIRRAAQLLAVRPDLEVISLRGNVDTRLRRLAGEVTGGGSSVKAGERGGEREREREQGGERGGKQEREQGGERGAGFDAIVLASAGLHRLGRERDIGCTLDVARFVPAPGQGALALQAKEGDTRTSEAVASILDDDASACLAAERTVARALGASCNTPLGANAVPAGCGCLHLRAWVGLPDGSEWLADELVGGFYDPAELGTRMAERLRAAGAGELLRRAEEMAVEG